MTHCTRTSTRTGGSHPRDPIRGRVAAFASAGLAVVVALMAVSGLWTAGELRAAADRALAAVLLSDAYDRSATAIATEESLERKYRLEPGPGVRARFDAATTELLTALDAVHRDGGVRDKALVGVVRITHVTHLGAVGRMFAAVDRGDTQSVLRIDG